MTRFINWLKNDVIYVIETTHSLGTTRIVMVNKYVAISTIIATPFLILIFF